MTESGAPDVRDLGGLDVEGAFERVRYDRSRRRARVRARHQLLEASLLDRRAVDDICAEAGFNPTEEIRGFERIRKKLRAKRAAAEDRAAGYALATGRDPEAAVRALEWHQSVTLYDDEGREMKVPRQHAPRLVDPPVEEERPTYRPMAGEMPLGHALERLRSPDYQRAAELTVNALTVLNPRVWDEPVGAHGQRMAELHGIDREAVDERFDLRDTVPGSLGAEVRGRAFRELVTTFRQADALVREVEHRGGALAQVVAAHQARQAAETAIETHREGGEWETQHSAAQAAVRAASAAIPTSCLDKSGNSSGFGVEPENIEEILSAPARAPFRSLTDEERALGEGHVHRRAKRDADRERIAAAEERVWCGGGGVKPDPGGRPLSMGIQASTASIGATRHRRYKNPASVRGAKRGHRVRRRGQPGAIGSRSSPVRAAARLRTCEVSGWLVTRTTFGEGRFVYTRRELVGREDTLAPIPLVLHCDHRLCPVCARRRAEAKRRLLEPTFSRLRAPSFISFTQRNLPGEELAHACDGGVPLGPFFGEDRRANGARAILPAFARLKTWKRWKDHVRGAFFTLEPHHGEAGMWHPHLHGVAELKACDDPECLACTRWASSAKENDRVQAELMALRDERDRRWREFRAWRGEGKGRMRVRAEWGTAIFRAAVEQARAKLPGAAELRAELEQARRRVQLWLLVEQRTPRDAFPGPMAGLEELAKARRDVEAARKALALHGRSGYLAQPELLRWWASALDTSKSDCTVHIKRPKERAGRSAARNAALEVVKYAMKGEEIQALPDRKLDELVSWMRGRNLMRTSGCFRGLDEVECRECQELIPVDETWCAKCGAEQYDAVTPALDDRFAGVGLSTGRKVRAADVEWSCAAHLTAKAAEAVHVEAHARVELLLVSEERRRRYVQPRGGAPP